MKLRAVIPLALVAALVVLFRSGLQHNPGAIPSPFIGKAAPAFDLEGLGDPATRVLSEDFLGKPFVLNVWGTWCPGCRVEHDTLLRIARSSEIPIVGVNWRDERPAAIGYLRQAGDPFAACGFDPNGKAAIDWGVYGAPESFLVNAEGIVIYKHIGPLDWQTWQREFENRIADAGGG